MILKSNELHIFYNNIKMDANFNLFVRSREGIVYKGEVDSITSFNEEGEFDVLAQHANFISLIQKALIIRDLSGKVKKIDVSNALMRVRKNYVEVYLGVEGIMTGQLEGAEHFKEDGVKQAG